MISSTLPRVTRIAVIGGASVRAGLVAQAVAQIPNVEIVEVPVEEKREPVSSWFGSSNGYYSESVSLYRVAT